MDGDPGSPGFRRRRRGWACSDAGEAAPGLGDVLDLCGGSSDVVRAWPVLIAKSGGWCAARAALCSQGSAMVPTAANTPAAPQDHDCVHRGLHPPRRETPTLRLGSREQRSALPRLLSAGANLGRLDGKLPHRFRLRPLGDRPTAIDSKGIAPDADASSGTSSGDAKRPISTKRGQVAALAHGPHLRHGCTKSPPRLENRRRPQSPLPNIEARSRIRA